MATAGERSTFDNVSHHASETEFGVSVAQWVAQTYPHAIRSLEQLSQEGQFRELVASAVPELRSQLDDANRILTIASASPSTIESRHPSETGSVGRQDGAQPR